MDFLENQEDVFQVNDTIEDVAPLSAILEPNVNVSSDQNVVAKLSPSNFDMLTKILGFLEKSADAIVIHNSSICQNLKGAIVVADIHKVFDDKDVDFEILNPKKTIKLLKQFRNNADTYIIKDDDNQRFIFTNGEIRLFMPYQVSSSTDSALPDDIKLDNPLYSTKMDKSTSKQIIGLASESNYVEFIIHDSKFKAIHIPETAIFLFDEFIKDSISQKLDETNAEVLLRSDVFLPISAEEYDIKIFKKDDDTYYSFIECNIGFDKIKIGIYEDLKDATGGNLFG